MGRKPPASSRAEEERPPPVILTFSSSNCKSHGGNLPLIGEGFGAKTIELLPQLPEKLPKNGKAASTGIKPPCESVNPSVVVTRSQPKRKYNSSVDCSKIKAKKPKAPVHRSGRLPTAVVPAKSKDIVPEVEEVTAWDGEEERSAPPAHEETRLPELSLNEKKLEEKVTSLSEVVEQLKIRFEELNSKFEEMEGVWSRTPGAATSTDRLHEECQKKNEALANENRELTKKLCNAYMMYSKGNCLFGGLLEKVKEIMLLFGLKAADMDPSAPDAANSIPGRGLVNGMS